jgi:hypothetical protein
MQAQEVGGPGTEEGVSAPLIVAELDLEHVAAKPLHNGANLTPAQPLAGPCPFQGYDVE